MNSWNRRARSCAFLASCFTRILTPVQGDQTNLTWRPRQVYSDCRRVRANARTLGHFSRQSPCQCLCRSLCAALCQSIGQSVGEFLAEFLGKPFGESFGESVGKSAGGWRRTSAPLALGRTPHMQPVEPPELNTMTADEFFAKWTQESELFRRRDAHVSGAALCDELLADVRAVLDSDLDSALPLAAAAERSGYSVEHLGRLVRHGDIPNAGRMHAPRIRVRDLPRKARVVATAPSAAYDAATDARNLLSRQRGG